MLQCDFDDAGVVERIGARWGSESERLIWQHGGLELGSGGYGDANLVEARLGVSVSRRRSLVSVTGWHLCQQVGASFLFFLLWCLGDEASGRDVVEMGWPTVEVDGGCRLA